MLGVSDLCSTTELEVIDPAIQFTLAVSSNQDRCRGEAAVVNLFLVAMVQSTANKFNQLDAVKKGQLGLLPKECVQSDAVKVVKEDGGPQRRIRNVVTDAEDIGVTLYVLQELRFSVCRAAELLPALCAGLFRNQVTPSTPLDFLVVRVNRQAVLKAWSLLKDVLQLISPNPQCTRT